MKFRIRYYPCKPSVEGGDLVEAILSYETSLTHGEIETLRKKTELLANMIQFLVSRMSTQDMIEFANFFGYEEDEWHQEK